MDMTLTHSLKTEHIKFGGEPSKDQLSLESHPASHIKSIHDAIKYNCSKCDIHYKTVDNLKQHQKYYHGRVLKKPEKCQQCGKSVYNLKEHIIVHNGIKLYKCPTCKASYSRDKCLKEHIRKKHLASQKEQMTLTEQENFTKIVPLANNRRTKQNKQRNGLPNSDQKSSKRAIFNFGNKQKKPTAFVKPLLHTELNSEDKNNQMNNILVADNEEIREDNPIDDISATDVCDVQAMEDEMVLLEQKEIEEIDEEWEEHVNDEKDTFEKEVSSDKKEDGTLQTSFVDSGLVQEGVAQTNRHIKEKDKKCNVCHQVFSRDDSLKRHIMFKHTQTNRPVQEKDKKCHKCEKLFRRKDNLKKHIMLKHTQTNTPVQEKEKKCLKCDKLFSRNDSLKKHIMLKHTKGNIPVKAKNNKCKDCDKMFRHPYQLKDHINNRHKGVRPFKCEQCNHDFVRVQHLKNHILVHY